MPTVPNTALIRSVPERGIMFPIETVEMRSSLLTKAESVVQVSNDAQNGLAVAVQASLKRFLTLIEAGRKLAKQPAIDEGRAIDAKVAGFVALVNQESDRIDKLLGDYAQAQEAQRKSALAANNNTLTELERQREAELAKAKSLIEREMIHQLFDQRALAAQEPLAPPARTEGQSLRPDWEIIEIQDYKLYQVRPDLARRIEWDKVAIKRELDRGKQLPGVKAREIIRSVVRAEKVKEPIEV